MLLTQMTTAAPASYGEPVRELDGYSEQVQCAACSSGLVRLFECSACELDALPIVGCGCCLMLNNLQMRLVGCVIQCCDRGILRRSEAPPHGAQRSR